MSLLSKEEMMKNNKAVSQLFNIYLCKVIEPEELVKIIDEAMFDLARYRLTDPDYTGNKSGFDVIYYLRDLKNVLVRDFPFLEEEIISCRD